MTISVSIRPGCTGMGSCARIAPQVFRLDPSTGLAEVVAEDLAPHRDGIIRAARSCPFVGVEIDGVPLDEPISEAQIVSITPLAPSVVELRVRCKGYRFVPGQYAFVRFTDERGEFFRSYSVVEASDGVVVFCVRLVPQGRGGTALAKLKPGARLGLSRAAGSFSLLTTDQPKLFITGGTGLAPVLPMLLAAPEAEKTVIFGGRSTHDFFYLERLQSAPKTTVILVASDPPPTWRGARGLVTHALEDLDISDFAEAYTSGSPGMVTAVRDRLIARGFPADKIFSDAFESGGTTTVKASQSVARKHTAPTSQRDWPGLLRQMHFHASLALALVFLFYAVTGFVANRVAWFVAEDTTPANHADLRIPETVGLQQTTLEPYLLALLPPGTQPKTWKDAESRSLATYVLAEREFEFSVDHEERSFVRTDWRQLPADLDLAQPTLLPWLNSRFPGEIDHHGIEEDDQFLSAQIESVWGKHLIQVDKQQRRLNATSTHPHLVISLIDLHRGKHTGFVQRFIVDLAAIALIGLTLSGIAMGLLASGRRRRITAAAVTISLFVLVLLLIAR